MTGQVSSSSSFSYQWTYDIFINFRGKDTRNGFVGNLFNALRRKGIRPFMDDGELRKGDEITPSLFKAIEKSRMAITVFSKNYASSMFCLDELVNILRCIKGNGRLVWPIFYDVEPSDVRRQKGNYEQALALHQENLKASEQKLQIWKQALREAANISGLHFNPAGNEYEYQFIEKIVKEISNKINMTPLHIANYPVGLKSRVREVNSLLEIWLSDKVIVVGIYGIGGMGKSTIARAVYNSIADQFDALCFLHDIKEKSSKIGLEKMQEEMLFKVVGMDSKVEDVNEGVPIIQRRLKNIKILLVLDNVDKYKQIEKLSGDCDWFGSGSRIIITSRDKHLIIRHGVERIYEVPKFNYTESHEFFSWNAFKNKQVDLGYWEVLNSIIDYAQGLPLALEVIGSNLRGKSIDYWKSALNKYRRSPDKEVQAILKVSFDGLEEEEQKIFLDIASFFKGEELKYVKEMVRHARGFDPDCAIEVLIDKSLINIERGHVSMHDLIRDIGRELVRKESPEEPGKRSRLWYHEDIVDVLEENKGTDKISYIIQDNFSEDIKVNWDGKAFEKIKNLKILIFKKAWFSEGPKYLPNSLRVLQWPEYPSSSLPVDFHPRKLAILDLKNSCFQLLAPFKKLENLSVLSLKGSQLITHIPDISGIPNLTKLRLDFCKNLIEIHNSVGFMEKLEILSAHSCAKLRTFPGCIRLPSLQHLYLGWCTSLEKFPEVLEKMEHITELRLNGTNLELPFSIRNLTGLQLLEMDYCGKKASSQELEGTYIERCEELQSDNQDTVKEELSSIQYSKATDIYLSRANISDELLSKYLPWFTNVEYLDLSFNNFTILPACIEDCYNLSKLYLNHCKHLSEIRGIPPNVRELEAINCTSLSLESKSMLLSQKLHENGHRTFIVPGASIPEWFNHFSCGASISLWVRFRENDYLTISLCVVVTPSVDTNPALEKKWYNQELFANLIVNGTNIHKHLQVGNLTPLSPMFSDHIVVKLSLFNSLAWNDELLNYEYNHVEVHMYVETRDTKDKLISVKKIGINLMKQGNRRDDIHFINPYKRRKLNDLNRDSSFGVPTGCKGLLNPLLCSHIFHLIDRDTEKWKNDNWLEEILREGMNGSEKGQFWYDEKLWEVQLPKKIKIFLWKAQLNWLTLKENIVVRGINGDDHTCPNCGAVGESIMHTLVACPFAEVIWSMSPLMLRSQSLPQASFSSWWEGLSSSMSYLQDSTGMLEIAGFICWRIWKCRNEKVFNMGSTGARQVISLVIQQVNEFQRLLRNG